MGRFIFFMRLLLFIIILLPITSIAQVGSTCQGRVNGTYICLNEDYESWDITLEDSIMVQSNSEYELKITSEIEWTSECQFTSTITKVKGPKQEGLLGKSTVATIIRLNPRSLVIETKEEGEKKIWRYQKKK